MKKLEVVLISTPGIGNLVPTVEFARRLINHDPRLSATILIISIPQRPIVNSYVQSQASSSDLRFFFLPPADPPSPDQFQTSLAFLSLFIEKHKSHVKHAIDNLMSSSNPSGNIAALFVDMFCTPMIDVGNEFNIPCYLYFASPAGFLNFMLHLPILDKEITTEFTESGTELIIPGFANSVPSQVLPNLVMDRKADAYLWLLHHAKRYHECKGIVVNSFQELEPYALAVVEKSPVPPVYAIGPTLDLAGPIKWHPNRTEYEKIIKWLDDQPPLSVVFLCFGSMGSLESTQITEIAIGLERAGYRFIWSLREPPKGKIDLPGDYVNPDDVLPDGFMERIDGVGFVCGLAPQVTVLAHRAVGGFVSHCGWNSILESVWHGVPIATWPIYAEQQMNAFEMVKELGLAVEIRLDYREGSKLVTAEELVDAINRLMDEKNEIRDKVKEMKEKSRIAMMENGSSDLLLRPLIKELVSRI